MTPPGRRAKARRVVTCRDAARGPSASGSPGPRASWLSGGHSGPPSLTSVRPPDLRARPRRAPAPPGSTAPGVGGPVGPPIQRPVGKSSFTTSTASRGGRLALIALAYTDSTASSADQLRPRRRFRLACSFDGVVHVRVTAAPRWQLHLSATVFGSRCLAGLLTCNRPGRLRPLPGRHDWPRLPRLSACRSCSITWPARKGPRPSPPELFPRPTFCAMFGIDSAYDQHNDVSGVPHTAAHACCPVRDAHAWGRPCWPRPDARRPSVGINVEESSSSRSSGGDLAGAAADPGVYYNIGSVWATSRPARLHAAVLGGIGSMGAPPSRPPHRLPAAERQ